MTDGYKFASKAEKILATKWYVKILSPIDYDKVIDLFTKAKIEFLKSKNYNDAVATLDQMADVYFKLGEDNFGINVLSEALKIAMTKNVERVDLRAEELIKLYRDHGEFFKSSDTAYNVGCYYSKNEDYTLAEKFLVLAKESAESISQPNLDIRICEELGRVYFYLENYVRSYEELEACARKMIESHISKYGAKDRFFDALLVYIMLHDSHSSRNLLSKYLDYDPLFNEFEKFFNNILDQIDEGDIDAFSKTVLEFDMVRTLNRFRTTALLKIKKTIGKVDLT